MQSIKKVYLNFKSSLENTSTSTLSFKTLFTAQQVGPEGGDGPQQIFLLDWPVSVWRQTNRLQYLKLIDPIRLGKHHNWPSRLLGPTLAGKEVPFIFHFFSPMIHIPR